MSKITEEKVVPLTPDATAGSQDSVTTPKEITRLLIANRGGEIACRIIETAKKMA